MNESEVQKILGVEKLNSVQNDLEKLAGHPRWLQYWKTLLTRIEAYPTECAILESRRSIVDLWTKCLKDKNDLERLKNTWSNEFSETVLCKHKHELMELKTFYMRNRELIEMIQEYESLWQRLTQLDQQFNDPDRLFKNRKALLLQEENDRRIIKKLPHVERAILQRLEQRRKEGEEEFFVFGETFSDLLQRRWEEQKENAPNLIRSCSLSDKRHQRYPSAGLVARQRQFKEDLVLSSGSITKRRRSNDALQKRLPTSSPGCLDSKIRQRVLKF